MSNEYVPPAKRVTKEITSTLRNISKALKEKRTDDWVPNNLNMMGSVQKLQHAVIHMANVNGMSIHEIALGMDLSKEAVRNALETPFSMELEVGAIVASINPQNNPLHCGSGCYDCAVIVSMEPFVLVSMSADMRWGFTWSADQVEVIGKATEEQLAKCMTRLES